MEKIILPCRAGKTYKIVRRVLETGGYLLVFGEGERKRLLREYPDLAGAIFSWEGMPHALRGKERKPVFIDNADMWLRELVGGFELKGISLG